MPTAKPRVTITMDSEQLNKIEAYRFKHRCKNQTQAILSLIETGFSALKANGENFSSENLLTEDDIQVAKKYSNLDAHGKKIVNLVLNEEYERNNAKTDIPNLVYEDCKLPNTVQKAGQTPAPYTKD